MKPPATVLPTLDVSVESGTFMRTFQEYERLTSQTPAQAVEKQAVNLRVKLIRGFSAVKLRKGQAARELKQRGGRIMVRKSIRDSYKGTNVFLGGMVNQKSKEQVKGKDRKGTIKGVPAWKEAVRRELSARNRSRAFLAASWLSSFQANGSGQGQTGVFVSKVKSGEVTGQTSVRTTGTEPEIVLRNIVEGVAKVGFNRGIIARAMRETSDDMRVYIVRKLNKNAQTLANS